MNFQTAVVTCFRKYWIGSGRASRSEYWWFSLFLFIAGFIAAIVDAALFGVLDSSGQINGPEPFYWVFTLITFLPSFCVLFRRLHDVNRSGWWWLISLTVIGLIPLIIWFCTKGTAGDNRFGPDPLGQTPSAA